MKHATLRQLRVFESVARHMSFSRAAEELHLTQPAVSAQVKELAAHAGLPLFEKVGRRIFLTPAGSELLGCARSVTAVLRDTDEALAQLKGVRGGQLNVAVISAGDYFFPRVLAEFTRRYPGVTLNLTVHNREGLLRHLNENLTDLAVMVRPPERQDIVAASFAPHPYVIVAPPGHRLARARYIPRSALAAERFVTRERGSDTWNSMQEVFGRQLNDLNVAMEIRSTETIKQAVIAGMGISFLSAHTIGLELRTGLLTVLRVEDFPAMLDWYLVHHASKRLPPVAQAFKIFLLAEGAQLIDRLVHFRLPGARAAAANASKRGAAPRTRNQPR
jgi:LysR family transcriptional regulator, low CO2-responsive transcriptional regulator